MKWPGQSRQRGFMDIEFLGIGSNDEFENLGLHDPARELETVKAGSGCGQRQPASRWNLQVVRSEFHLVRIQRELLVRVMHRVKIG